MESDGPILLILEAMAGRLDEDDDPELWRAVLQHVLAEVEPGPGLLVEVGRCSRRLRPHTNRWKADGGFAWPSGYGIGVGKNCRSGLPQFDWSVPLGWGGAGWGVIDGRTARTTLRLAVPSRTRRHRQAAVHALWHTGREKEMVLCGFRKREAGWTCTVATRSASSRGALNERRSGDRFRARFEFGCGSAAVLVADDHAPRRWPRGGPITTGTSKIGSHAQPSQGRYARTPRTFQEETIHYPSTIQTCNVCFLPHLASSFENATMTDRGSLLREIIASSHPSDRPTSRLRVDGASRFHSACLPGPLS